MNDPDVTIKRFGAPVTKPAISVIVVTYNAGAQVFDCLDSVRRQGYRSYELILVDNGELDEALLDGYDLYYVPLGDNRGPSYARNVGAGLSKGAVLALLDDDAVALDGWLEAIANRFRDPVVSALRGKVLPERDHLAYNLAALHYDLGNEVKPWFLDVEGNCAVRARAFVEAGGFDDELFGAEGLDLSYRLDDELGGRIFYDPSVVIRHDYADSLFHLVCKSFRHGFNEVQQGVTYERLGAYRRRFFEQRNGLEEEERRGRAWAKTRRKLTLRKLSSRRVGSQRGARIAVETAALLSLARFVEGTGKLSARLLRRG